VDGNGCCSVFLQISGPLGVVEATMMAAVDVVAVYYGVPLP